MKQRIDCPYYDLLVLHTWPVLQAEESEFWCSGLQSLACLPQP
jgi:hypothetical protein